MPDPEIVHLLERSLAELPSPAASETSARLAQLAEMVATWGARMNLTGHRTPLEVAQALVADAVGLLVQLERFTNAELSGRIVDLGSGAGFPGLPIAIVRGACEVHMVEAREKRHYFQRAACRQLAISNAHPVHGRIESRPIGDADWVLAQAVGPIDEVIEAMRWFVRPGGHLVVPGSDRLQAPPGVDDLHGHVVSYRSPGLGLPRKVWIGTSPEIRHA